MPGSRPRSTAYHFFLGGRGIDFLGGRGGGGGDGGWRQIVQRAGVGRAVAGNKADDGGVTGSGARGGGGGGGGGGY